MHSKFKPEEDLILVPEVMAAKAYIASYGYIHILCKIAANKASRNAGLAENDVEKCPRSVSSSSKTIR